MNLYQIVQCHLKPINVFVARIEMTVSVLLIEKQMLIFENKIANLLVNINSAAFMASTVGLFGQRVRSYEAVRKHIVIDHFGVSRGLFDFFEHEFQ